MSILPNEHVVALLVPPRTDEAKRQEVGDEQGVETEVDV